MWREREEEKKTAAKEATLSRKAVKGKEFMQTNICDISSLHTRSPIPLALGVPNAKVGLTKTAKSEGIFWLAQVLCMLFPLMAMCPPDFFWESKLYLEYKLNMT